MKRLVSSSLVALMTAAVFAAASAMADPARKTELVDLDGKSIDNIQLRHSFEGVWVVDTQNVLWRDSSRDHYLVTLSEACKQLAVRRAFAFHPADVWELDSSKSYEVWPFAGRRCDVAKIEQVGDAKATSLKEIALRRAW
jgi:hypothetical protein